LRIERAANKPTLGNDDDDDDEICIYEQITYFSVKIF
jgi:hypothetical protein